LYIHGGPHNAFGHIFFFEFLVLAGAGYAVLFINHRGSSGYGDRFCSQTIGNLGNLEYQDMMAAVDYVVDKGLADPDRLGCCGLSGGGHLTCWIVGHTERFKAAVAENPITNFVSFYGVSANGVRIAVDELGGHPHEIPNVYRRCSPITHAHRCTTPTLLIQGENDRNCPPEQSEQFYTALKANGCPTEMLRLPNGVHTGSLLGPPIVRRTQDEALLEWMNRYVLDFEPTERENAEDED
jgi:dipeptidyl aminopeptidase/acylaminoacyl peptidase